MNTNSENKLNLCPFCGGVAELKCEYYRSDPLDRYYAECTRCAARGGESSAIPEKLNQEMATELWNNRMKTPTVILKPCPFCGVGNAGEVIRSHTNVYIKCVCCGIRTEDHECDSAYSSFLAAATQWNARVNHKSYLSGLQDENTGSQQGEDGTEFSECVRELASECKPNYQTADRLKFAHEFTVGSP